MERRVAVFVGSLCRASWSRKVAQALIALAPPLLRPEIVEIGQLPLYNQDFDDNGYPPPAWTAFRQQVKAYDTVLFVTPEYNRSVPAPLKNAIDVGCANAGGVYSATSPKGLTKKARSPIRARRNFCRSS